MQILCDTSSIMMLIFTFTYQNGQSKMNTPNPNAR